MMIPLSYIAAHAGGAAGVAADVFFGVGSRMMEASLKFLLGLVKAVDGVPGGHILVAKPSLWLVALFYLALMFLLSENFRIIRARRMRTPAKAAAAAIAAISLLVAACPLGHPEHDSLVFVDVGQGDCLHVRTPDGKNYLIDGGGSPDYDVGKNILLPYLLSSGVTRLDGVFATHLHADHFKGLADLSKQMPIGRLYVYDGSRPKAAQMLENTGFEEDGVSCVGGGDRIALGRGVWIDVLYPARQPGGGEAVPDEDENKSCLLFRINYQGVKVLMTGDIGEEGETDILQGIAPKADILKVGHHGSKTSTTDAFLAAVAPKFAVIQVGRNNFGHPAAEVLEKLAAAGIPVLRNDLDGAVMVDIKGGRAEFRAMEPGTGSLGRPGDGRRPPS